MNVIFLSPAYPLEMQDYTRGLAEVGANVIGVGEGPLASLPRKVQKYLADYVREVEKYANKISDLQTELSFSDL